MPTMRRCATTDFARGVARDLGFVSPHSHLRIRVDEQLAGRRSERGRDAERLGSLGESQRTQHPLRINAVHSRREKGAIDCTVNKGSPRTRALTSYQRRSPSNREGCNRLHRETVSCRIRMTNSWLEHRRHSVTSWSPHNLEHSLPSTPFRVQWKGAIDCTLKGTGCGG
jgi:hypothetical protein